MNQLTVTEKQAFEKLPPSLHEFAKNRMEKQVGMISDLELRNPCLDIISVAFAEQNQYNVEHTILAHQRDFLIAELKDRRFKTLTLSEVRSAFKLGIRGESGPFFGLCPKTYHQFLKFYYEKPERTEAMKQFLALNEQPEKKELSEEQKEQIVITGMLNHFIEYKQTGTKVQATFAGVYFKTLEKKGILVLSKKEKLDLFTQAEKEYVNELKTKKLKGHLRLSEYDNLVSNLLDNASVKSTARKIALYQYFDSLLTQGKELKDMMK